MSQPEPPTLCVIYGPPAVGKLTVARVVCERRAAHGKLVSPDALRRLLDDYDFTKTVPGSERLVVDTVSNAPATAAGAIADHLARGGP